MIVSEFLTGAIYWCRCGNCGKRREKVFNESAVSSSFLLEVPVCLFLLPTMTPLKTNDASHNYQETELVFINSTPEKGTGLPVARVFKRKDGRYMRFRSPCSPTLSAQSRHKIKPMISGSWAERYRDDGKVQGAVLFGLNDRELEALT